MRYIAVNPLTTCRVREARQFRRVETNLTDAEQIADLCRTALVTRTQLETRPYPAPRIERVCPAQGGARAA